MNRFLGFLSNKVLQFFQRRCQHPPGIVTADLLEGCVEGIEIKYCNRCGAVKLDWNPLKPSEKNFRTLEHWWRGPDPFLWRYWKR